MHRALVALSLLVPAGLALAGCELVFGLDDYAQATSEATTGATGTDAGPGSGAGSSSSTGSDSTGSAGDGGGDASSTSSSSGGGGDGCPCVPDGWTLIEAYPTTLEATALECPSGTTAERVLGDVTVACECSCSIAGGLESRLACWSDADCAGTLNLLESGVCATMPPAKSCQRALTRDGEVTDDICIASSVVLATGADNPFDVCDVLPDGVSCGDEGVCDAPSEGALWCIQGTIDQTCPADWPDDHTLSEGGNAACECDCTDDVTALGGWSVANPNEICFNQNTDITSRMCENVPDLTRFHGGPPFGDQVGGGCTPVQNQPAGRFEGAVETRLCCRPG